MTSQSKSQSNSGFNRRLFLAGAAGGAMIPVAAGAQPPGTKKKRGIFADPAGITDLQDRVADFSYQNDVLAQLIVDMWTTPAVYNDLMTPPLDYTGRSSRVKKALEDRGIYLASPIVITEDEYETGFSLNNAGLTASEGVVLVLPRKTRATTTTTGGMAPPLLETAKMLMALTPNGI